MPVEVKSTTVAAVLLVPGDAHKHVLAPGPCGALPPTALRVPGGPSWWAGPRVAHHHDQRHMLGPVALVLAWDGKPVWQGIECVKHVAGVARKPNLLVAFALSHEQSNWPEVSWNALLDRIAPFGTVVLLDAQGNEVTP